MRKSEASKIGTAMAKLRWRGKTDEQKREAATIASKAAAAVRTQRRLEREAAEAAEAEAVLA